MVPGDKVTHAFLPGEFEVGTSSEEIWYGVEGMVFLRVSGVVNQVDTPAKSWFLARAVDLKKVAPREPTARPGSIHLANGRKYVKVDTPSGATNAWVRIEPNYSGILFTWTQVLRDSGEL